MVVVENIMVEYFLDSRNFGSRMVVVDDTTIVIDKLDRVTIVFQNEDTVRKDLSFVTPGSWSRFSGFGCQMGLEVILAHVKEPMLTLGISIGLSYYVILLIGEGINVSEKPALDALASTFVALAST
ncbi:hypothetical protein Tco_0487074 [Tanacetum coccineum]